MIKFEQGAEYHGETYIWCTQCAPSFGPGLHHWREVMTQEKGVFQGESLTELLTFIAAHSHNIGEIRHEAMSTMP